jgi:hypothetical protein
MYTDAVSLAQRHIGLNALPAKITKVTKQIEAAGFVYYLK